MCEGLFESEAFGQVAAHGHVFEGFDGEVRIDGAGAIADQQGEVHDFARLAGFDDERDLGAGFFADQVVVHGGQGEQAGNGRVVFVDAAVGKDQQRVAGLDGEGGAAAESIEGAFKASFAVFDARTGGQGGGEEIALRDAAQLFEVAVAEDGMLQA